MKKLKITVSPTGEVSMQVEGVAGAGCLGETEFLESALGGRIESRDLTADYYASAEVGESQKVGG